ncbi:type II secretion system F family protein [Persicimonas caeni]|nr:type II secretion system F family protein [Persicimonas caeni]
MTDPQAEQFCQTFADGLESGIGYARILDILARQDFDKKTIGRLREALLERGDLLGEALARYGLLDPNARKLILVAEEQGVLPESFAQLGRIYGKRYARKKAFAASLIEPLILIALGLIVFRNIIGGNIVKLAFSRDTNERIIDILIMSGIESAMFALACFVVFFLWLNLPVDFAPRDLFSRIWMRMPVVSDPGRHYSVALFCRYLQQSIDSGMTVYQGIELAAEASNHPGILDHYQKAQKRIEDGYSLAEALNTIRTLPVEVLENVDIGEESGRLDERLTFLAQRYEDKANESFKNRMSAYTWILRYGIIVLVISMVLMSISELDFL